MLAGIPAVHSNLNRTSLFSISKYGKITGKMVHSNHFFKAPPEAFQQHRELPTLNPTTNIKIDQQNILIGFGGSQEGVQSAPVGVEFESNCSRTTVNLRFLTSFTDHLIPDYLIPNIDLSNIAFPSRLPDLRSEYRPQTTNRIYLRSSPCISGEFPIHPNINAS